jgi:hypothetical protein
MSGPSSFELDRIFVNLGGLPPDLLIIGHLS